LFVGVMGVDRVVARTAELMRAHGDDGVEREGGVPLTIIQRYINQWYSLSLDLFGGEISSNAANYFGAGLKGRFKEAQRYTDHRVIEDHYRLTVVEEGALKEVDIPLRNAMNEVLRDDYIKDCERALRKWNRLLEAMGSSTRLTLPSRRFHRHQGLYAAHAFNPAGDLVSADEFERRRDEWLLSPADNEYLRSIMVRVREPGKFANWIAPPAKGIGGQDLDFAYVRA
ncbi:MAG: benzoyl-CoA 2,3-epoxidase subunit BoxB, partial [Myxococcales bacterium]|nr:benzoyl-CoA 2,3-epoxidase subunit BoxB [Myxococcales bacterium]